MVTNFGELEHKICHNSACIRCISKMIVSNMVYGIARWHLGLRLAWSSLIVTVSNLENIIVFVFSATNCF